jgi:hypothetical protein
MNYLEAFLYYSFFATVILFTGIGTNKLLDSHFDKLKSITYCSKIILSIILSSLFGWLITKGILVPLKITELFPLVCLLIYICVDAFLEAIVRLTTGKSSAEFIFSYLLIVLSISESLTIVNTLVITTGSLIAFLGMIPFIMAFRKRNCDTKSDIIFCRLFLYLALLILALSSWDVSWLNPEVFQ